MNTTTERMMLDHLHHRYSNTVYMRRANGMRWVCAEHVRNDAGFWSARTADFVAVDMWPSTGNAIHGHEIKVSRSDWLCELRQPEKWLPFASLVDYWWIVVPDLSIVKPRELQHNWGLLVLGKQALYAKVVAPRLNWDGGTSLLAHRAVRPLPKGFAAALLRATAKTRAVGEA